MMNKNYLFYICSDVGSVFDSQVLGLLNTLSEKKIFKKIYLVLGIRGEKHKNNISKKIIADDLEIIFYKHYPNYPFFNFTLRKSLSQALNKSCVNFDNVLFHTRGELAAWHLSKIIGQKYYGNIIPDIRGASIEEVSEYFEINKINKFFKIYNYKSALKSLNNFKKISAVSNSLKEYLIKSYGIDSDKIAVNPSFAGKDFKYDQNQRIRIRTEMKLAEDDNLIVFSSGGTANWQNYDILIALAEKGMKILNLSKKEILHRNIINKFVDHTEVSLYLNAADTAIIWRDNSTVNKVASPVKFSEYICCGLPVIANKSVGTIKDFLGNHSCGLFLNTLDELNVNVLNKLKQLDRKEISQNGKETFGIDKIINNYINLYFTN